MVGVHVSDPTVLTLNFPSFTILALDSWVADASNGVAVTDRYDKLIQLRPCVFLACFGDCSLIDRIRVAILSDLPENPRFVGDLAFFVQNTVNKLLGNAIDENGGVVGNNDFRNVVEFVLIGRCDLDSRCYVFNISKGPNNTWMCFAKINVERVATATTIRPIDVLTAVLRENVVDENLTEEFAIDYALGCLLIAIRYSWVSGGKIRVVVVKQGSSIVHAWEQDDPSNCRNPYFYRGHRRSEGY